jgi:hypothetical protein
MREIYDESGKLLRREENPFSQAALERAKKKRYPEKRAASDDEVNAAARAEWLMVLVEMWDAIGKDATPERLGLYERQLANIPLGLLLPAVSRAIRENGSYQTVPTVGAIWTAVKKELKNPSDLDSGLERWHLDQWRGVNMFENMTREDAQEFEPVEVYDLAAA